jgi:hypothetical protein
MRDELRGGLRNVYVEPLVDKGVLLHRQRHDFRS